jgi:hypothetical protein
MIARTGTHWDFPTNHIQAYHLTVLSGSQTIDLGVPKKVPGSSFDPIRESGAQGSWANWYGAVQSDAPAYLSGQEKLIIENRSEHGGVMSVWVMPLNALDSVSVSVKTNAPLNTFLLGQQPTIQIAVSMPKHMPNFEGFLRMDRYDLLEDKTETRFVPVSLTSSQTNRLEQTYPMTSGVFRVRAALVETAGDQPEPQRVSSGCLYAFAQTKTARDLPDDWPLGTHVALEVPVMPGFKWYRYFAGWHLINTGPGRYHWDNFDKIFKEVQQAGGKLMIADDGSPIWTCQRGKKGMPWAPKATAYPPDDWQTLSDYLDAMVARYEDKAGTLAALELCNEANTPERWLGTPQQMVEMAKVFRRAASQAKHPIQIIGISVSAGHHQQYVQQLVDAGILKYVDTISGHWYEELTSYEINTPINNLPLHVQLIEKPMEQAGFHLPMINSESGLAFVARGDGDRLVSQNQLNEQALKDPSYDPVHPWIRGNDWRPVSERRTAAAYVAGTMMLMAMDVKQSFYFSYLGFIRDGVPSLPWVALGEFGHHLMNVDYHHIQPLDAHVVDSDEQDGCPKAMAYLVGKPGERQFIAVWGFISDTRIGRSKHWQRWLDPVDIQIATRIKQGIATDMYGRKTWPVDNAAGKLTVRCGEEPVFITVK